MKIKRFEDIEAWKFSRELAATIYQKSQDGLFYKDFRLRDQIRSAATSIMANIAEGFDSQSDIEFIRFLVYSRRSASEVQSHLYVALDQKYISQENFKEFFEKTDRIKSLICGFIRYLNKRPKAPVPGPKS